jgi:hypothetical protein
MSKKKRVQRPKEELQRELVEQLGLLRHACEQYDRAMESIAKYISLNIRVLVHEHRQSRALLDQLGLRTIRFVDSAGSINHQNLLPEHRLLSIQITVGGVARYIPSIRSADDVTRPMRAVRFQDWWNDPVIKDADRRLFCRRDLVLNVADTDGGAHVDPELEEQYMALSRQNSLGWESFSGGASIPLFRNAAVTGQAVPLQGRPELACIRQIAHEVLCTIQRHVPEFAPHSSPVIPPGT